MDIWESKWRVTEFLQTIMCISLEIQENERKIIMKEIPEERGKRVLQIKKDNLEELRKEYLTIDSNGVAKYSKAMAEKLTICVIEPKKTADEWLELPDSVFSKVLTDITLYLDRDLIPRVFGLDAAIEVFTNHPSNELKTSEILEILKSIKDQELKKN